MPYGLPWSEELVRDLLSDKEMREEYVAELVKSRIAMLIRALREDRGWSQTKLGRKMGKPPNVISRLEDPDYGKMTLQTLLEVAAVFELPLFIDFPEWDDWLRQTARFDDDSFYRKSFNAEQMINQAAAAKSHISIGKIAQMQTGNNESVIIKGVKKPIVEGMIAKATSGVAVTIAGDSKQPKPATVDWQRVA